MSSSNVTCGTIRWDYNICNSCFWLSAYPRNDLSDFEQECVGKKWWYLWLCCIALNPFYLNCQSWIGQFECCAMQKNGVLVQDKNDKTWKWEYKSELKSMLVCGIFNHILQDNIQADSFSHMSKPTDLETCTCPVILTSKTQASFPQSENPTKIIQSGYNQTT